MCFQVILIVEGNGELFNSSFFQNAQNYFRGTKPGTGMIIKLIQLIQTLFKIAPAKVKSKLNWMIIKLECLIRNLLIRKCSASVNRFKSKTSLWLQWRNKSQRSQTQGWPNCLNYQFNCWFLFILFSNLCTYCNTQKPAGFHQHVGSKIQHKNYL